MNVTTGGSSQTQQMPGVAAVECTREKMYVRIT